MIDAMTKLWVSAILNQLYTYARMDRGEFNLAYIPSSQVPANKEFFDRKEMSFLFEIGFD